MDYIYIYICHIAMHQILHRDNIDIIQLYYSHTRAVSYLQCSYTIAILWLEPSQIIATVYLHHSPTITRQFARLQLKCISNVAISQLYNSYTLAEYSNNYGSYIVIVQLWHSYITDIRWLYQSYIAIPWIYASCNIQTIQI